MTGRSLRLRARKASLIAFAVVALAAVLCRAHDSNTNEYASATTTTNDPLETQVIEPGRLSSVDVQVSLNPTEEIQATETASEASRAYKQALSTLATLTALPPSQSEEPSYYQVQNGNGLQLSSFLPSIQGQGPIASAMRIVVKLLQQSWLPRSVKGYIKDELAGGRRKDDELHGKAVKVIDLLQHAAELGNMDALYTLGQVSLFPPNGHFSFDPALGYDAFSSHASLTGNASSQALLAFFHATGYHDVIPVDQAKAQLYFTFAAHGGHRGAQMALGYRYWSGIGVAESCVEALSWYEEAAEQAMAKFMSGPPGGRTLPLATPRLSDLEGGVYGPGASVASTGLSAGRPVIKTAIARAAGETWEDLLEYYLFNADRGEVDFAYRLGKIFYQGSVYVLPGGIASGGDGASLVPRDFARARYYFLRIARSVWPRDPPNPGQHQPPTKEERGERHAQAGYAALAAGYLGRMYLRGEGVPQDAAMAKMWFERGAEYGEKESHNGLGILWRDGLVDGKKDAKKAMAHFVAAASQELAEAQVNLGKLHYEKGDLTHAVTCFETAIRQGSPFEAYYYLAEIQARQAHNPHTNPSIAGSSCAIAVSFYKLVAERGAWGEDLLRDAEKEWHKGTDWGREMAMLRWAIAAERGMEVAQNNLAFVLDQDKSILHLPPFAPSPSQPAQIEAQSHIPSQSPAQLALTYWTRSAAQRNIDALVKVGDYYYHGLGLPEGDAADEAKRWGKAAGYYQSAADTQLSALAMWNLGWMYENGIGVPQDFHLAKRHYDSALSTNSEAYIPVTLSLWKLYARSIWHTLMGGSGGLSLWGDDEADGDLLYGHPPPSEGHAAEIEGGTREEELQEVEDQYEDGTWYLGKAREDFNRRRRGREVNELNRDEDDPVQWARDRRQADNDRDGDFGPEDYFEAATRRPYRAGEGEEDEDIDEFTETMILVALCLTVSLLLWVRGRWQERMRREEQERIQRQQQRQQDRPPAFAAPGEAQAQAPARLPRPPDDRPPMEEWEQALLR